jgi:hypothetical protein
MSGLLEVRGGAMSGSGKGADNAYLENLRKTDPTFQEGMTGTWAENVQAKNADLPFYQQSTVNSDGSLSGPVKFDSGKNAYDPATKYTPPARDGVAQESPYTKENWLKKTGNPTGLLSTTEQASLRNNAGNFSSKINPDGGAGEEKGTGEGLLSTKTTPTLSEVAPAGTLEAKPAVSSPANPSTQAVTGSPQTGVTTASSSYVAPEYTPGDNATVEGRLKGLLSTDSQYLEAARARAKGEANSRGLLNSTMAETAGEKAAIEAALPIATQDAQTFANSGLTGYQGKITSAQSSQTAGQAQEMAKLQAGLTTEVGAAQAKLDAALKSGLSAQEAMQTTLLATHQAGLQSGLNEQESLAKSALATLQAGLNSGLSAQESKQRVYEAAQTFLSQSKLSQQEQDAAMARLKTELESKGGLLEKQLASEKEIARINQEGQNFRSQAENALTAAKLDKDTREAGMQKVAAFHDAYTNGLQAVQRDPTVPWTEKEKILAQLQLQYKFNVQSVGDLYGIEIDWDGLPDTPKA